MRHPQGYDARAHCDAHGIDEQTSQPSLMQVAVFGSLAAAVLKALQKMDIEELRSRV